MPKETAKSYTGDRTGRKSAPYKVETRAVQRYSEDPCECPSSGSGGQDDEQVDSPGSLTGYLLRPDEENLPIWWDSDNARWQSLPLPIKAAQTPSLIELYKCLWGPDWEQGLKRMYQQYAGYTVDQATKDLLAAFFLWEIERAGYDEILAPRGTHHLEEKYEKYIVETCYDTFRPFVEDMQSLQQSIGGPASPDWKEAWNREAADCAWTAIRIKRILQRYYPTYDLFWSSRGGRRLATPPTLMTMDFIIADSKSAEATRPSKALAKAKPIATLTVYGGVLCTGQHLVQDREGCCGIASNGGDGGRRAAMIELDSRI
ncbi:hypothetical protein LTR95_007778 [Oleoguttula sp. CCFEE 5521]